MIANSQNEFFIFNHFLVHFELGFNFPKLLKFILIITEFDNLTFINRNSIIYQINPKFISQPNLHDVLCTNI